MWIKLYLQVVSTCVLYIYLNDNIASQCVLRTLWRWGERCDYLFTLMCCAVPCVCLCGTYLLRGTIMGNIAMSVKVLCSHLCYVLVIGVWFDWIDCMRNSHISQLVFFFYNLYISFCFTIFMHLFINMECPHIGSQWFEFESMNVCCCVAIISAFTNFGERDTNWNMLGKTK